MKMRYIDVLNEVVKGKKMWCQDLCNFRYNFYIYLDVEDGEVMYQSVSDLSNCGQYNPEDGLLFEADWEEYKEPEKTYNFAQAMDMVVNGKKMRRKTYSPNSHLFQEKGVIYYGWMNGITEHVAYVVQSIDVLANDWVEVKL